MIELRKVVLPMHLRPITGVAAGHAKRLAEPFHTEVHALHVVPAETDAASQREQGAAITLPPQPALQTARQRLA